MIKIPQPSMALNSHDVPGCEYKMWNTWKVAESTPPDSILGWVAEVAKATDAKKLKTLIINCHGYYNNVTRSGTGGFGLKIGSGIRRADTSRFEKLKGSVESIIITACGTARITTPGTGDGDGNLFCCEIAKASGAAVTAATTHQVGDLWLPFGYIDDWEGLVLTYGPAGNVVAHKNYGRGIVDWALNGGN